MTISLNNLQTISQLGAGLAFLFMGAMPYFQERIRHTLSECDKKLHLFRIPKNNNTSALRLADYFQELDSFRTKLAATEKLSMIVYSKSMIIFVIPAIIYTTSLVLFPFFPEFQFTGVIGITCAAVIITCWIPGAFLLSYIFYRIVYNSNKAKLVFSQIDNVFEVDAKLNRAA